VTASVFSVGCVHFADMIISWTVSFFIHSKLALIELLQQVEKVFVHMTSLGRPKGCGIRNKPV